MREYLLIWRALPKLLVGSIFLIEISLLILGEKIPVVMVVAVMRRLASYFSGATLLLAIVLVVGTTASLGLFFLEVASAASRAVATLALKLVPIKLRRGYLPLREIFGNPYDIALARFKDRADFFSGFYELKSSSFSTDALGKISEIKTYFTAVRSHILSGSSEDVEAITYFGLLGQDRRACEIIEDEIQILENLIVVLILMPALLVPLGVTGVPLAVSATAFIVVSLAILPEIARRKCFLASFLLTAYMDNFTVNEGADVADREGEAYF